MTGTNKPLPSGGPCDLVTAEDFAHVLNTHVNEIEIEATDQIQCDYYSESLLAGANVIPGQDLSKMMTNENVDLTGVRGMRLIGSDELCGVGVQLDGENPIQQFAVLARAVPSRTEHSPCDIADGVALAILGKLPGVNPE